MTKRWWWCDFVKSNISIRIVWPIFCVWRKRKTNYFLNQENVTTVIWQKNSKRWYFKFLVISSDAGFDSNVHAIVVNALDQVSAVIFFYLPPKYYKSILKLNSKVWRDANILKEWNELKRGKTRAFFSFIQNGNYKKALMPESGTHLNLIILIVH